MDNTEIKKALLMQLMKVLTESEMKPFKPQDTEDEYTDEESETPEMPEVEIELESDCEPGSKEDRMRKLKKLATAE